MRQPTRAMLALLLLFITNVHSLLDHLNFTSDARPHFLLSTFGFFPNGKSIVRIDSLQTEIQLPEGEITQEDQDKRAAAARQRALNSAEYPLGFFLFPDADETIAQLANKALIDEPCFINHPEVQAKGYKPSYLITDSRELSPWEFGLGTDSGLMSLVFVNCLSIPDETISVSMNLTLEQYNLLPDGSKSYLTAGETSMPTWYFLMCAAFIAQLVAWARVLHKAGRQNVTPLHWLMLCTVVFKICVLLFESLMYHQLKTIGNTHGWNIVFYVFSFLKGIFFFSVIALVGAGWNYMRPVLTENDKNVIFSVFGLQIVVNMATVVIDEWRPSHFGYYSVQATLYTVDLLCCVIILFPIYRSIQHLRESANVDGKAAQNMERLKRFQSFYLSTVAFIYFTRFIAFLLARSLPFEAKWLSNVLVEAATLAFYGYVGYLFRPQDKNPYVPLEQHDDLDEIDAELSELERETNI